MFLQSVDAFVKEHGIECEWTPRPTYDVCLSNEFKAYSDIAYDNVVKRGGAQDVNVHTGDAAPAVSTSSLLLLDSSHASCAWLSIP